MPEFQMNGQNDKEFLALDKFTQGYIKAMLFTECEQSTEFDPENGSQLPNHAAFENIAAETLQKIIDDCVSFQRSQIFALQMAYKIGKDYSEECAGTDFWFTRNGHGAGFWDRELKAAGDTLSKACGFNTDYPEIYVYWNDEQQLIETN